MKNTQLQVLQRLRDDFQFYARTCLKIVDKQTGQLIPFVFNRAQQYIHNIVEKQKKETGKVRVVIIKGRQQGCSTYVEGRFFHDATLLPGTSVFILAHISDSTNHLFGMAKKFYENAPVPILPTIDKMNERRLEFKGINSSYGVGTAGSASIGRGLTIRRFHGCLSADSLVVLSSGEAKPISKIEYGDLVITSSGAVAPVAGKTYTGHKEVFEIHTWLTNETIKASGDHKIFTDRGLLKLSEVTSGDYIRLPDMKIQDKIFEKTFTLELRERAQHGGSQPKTSECLPLDYDHGYLFGYYLAEGHVKKQWRYSDRHCNVSFAYHENETFIENILPLLEKYGTSVSTRHIARQHKKITTCYGTFFAELVKRWFGRVEGKRIPSWVFNTNKDFALGIVDGYFAGDGSKTSVGRVRAPSIHEQITRQLKRVLLAVTSGVPGVHRFERDRYGVPSKPILMLGLSGRGYDELYATPREKYRNERFKIEDGQRFVKIQKIISVGVQETWDIEVDHPDHNFETPVGIVSNSEVAFWDRSEEIASGALQAVPKSSDTEVFIESTANGPGDWFHGKVLAGLEKDTDGEFITIFVPWHWQPEYTRPTPPDFRMTESEEEIARLFKLTPGQLYWRRTVTHDDFGGDERRFMREYPNTVDEAFSSSGDSLIPSSDVITARKVKVSDPMAPLIIGCDPARSGDRTVITFRQGRRISEFKKYSQMDEMTLAGILAGEIDKRNVVKCFVDVGCGYGTVDRLRELGYGAIVTPIHFGQTAMQPDIFLNKRAEMAEDMRLWFAEGGVAIPDSDEFQTDILSVPPLEKSGSRGKLMLPSKEIIRKKLGKSPDIADSVMLTFAYPVAARAGVQRITRTPLDTSRPNSPLATVKDFNNPKVINVKTKLF